jgi:hypothetical protein
VVIDRELLREYLLNACCNGPTRLDSAEEWVDRKLWELDELHGQSYPVLRDILLPPPLTSEGLWPSNRPEETAMPSEAQQQAPLPA